MTRTTFTRAFSIGAVGALGLLVVACGSTDPTPAVDKLNRLYTTQMQEGLEKGGVPTAEAKKAAITIKCPDSVDKSKPFDCTVTGSLSGRSLDLEMQINNDALEPVSTSKQADVLNEIVDSEAKAVAAQS